MSVNEICGNETTIKTLNTGGKKQCLEGAVRTYILTKGDFKFDTLALAKAKANWETAKAAKNIVVFYDVEELEPNNTDAVITNGRFRDYKIKDSVKGVSYTHYLSTCSHEALKTYEDSEYTRMFRVTENNELLCVVNDDGSVQGEPITSFIVGERNDAPVDGTPSTQVQIKYSAYTQSVIIPDFDITDYEGIYDVTLTEGDSNSSTSLKVKVTTSCSGAVVTSLESGDLIVKDGAGS